ncbi:uncharacterized protein METZ01_LOCUS493728, partial [marine metagenome]
MAVETMAYREALFETMDSALAQSEDSFIIGQGVDDHTGIFGTTLGLA